MRAVLVAGSVVLASVAGGIEPPPGLDAAAPQATSTENLGVFESHDDIGPVRSAGDVTYDREQSTYVLSASGANMWFGEDEFHFVWRRMSGDFILSADAEFLGAGVDPHRKLGWMVRASLDDGAAYVDVARHGDGLTSLQFRRAPGADTGEVRSTVSEPDAMQAPNWTPDGKALIYNRNGLLYRFHLDSAAVEEIDTGFAMRNNNDHAISFDGRQLAISHRADDYDGQSMIYTLPVEGGTPRLVTREAPSYFHGFSPDGEWLVYTGGRGGNFDIYRIRADGGAAEVRLTDSPALDDGPEYSPDGRHIYFNSARTGTMELWRMNADGSGQEQVTDDEYNNWFPHPSPDGRRLVYLAYGPDVAADDHPWYRQVYLMLKSADGGVPRVIANVYGGQGTINVPSWSPDGRHIAFVSNTR